MADDRTADHPLSFPPPARPAARPGPRERASVAVLWVGRVLLAVGALAAAVSVAHRSTLHHSVVTSASIGADAGLWLAFAVAVVWLLALPLLVLPFGSVRLTRLEEHHLAVRTVLGTRRLAIPAQSVQLATVRSGFGPEAWFVGIRNGWRWVVVVASGGFAFPHELVRGVGSFPVDQDRDRTGNAFAGAALAGLWLVVVVVTAAVFLA